MLLAMAHTTLVCTMAQGSDAANVIPTNPKVVGNLRLLWGDTTESAIARLQKIIGDDQVQIRSLGGSEPQPDSRTDGSYDKLTAAIRATWPNAVPTPYLMVAGTDSRHWRELCDHVYRFSAKQVTREEKSCVHGNNERIRVENTEHAVQFYVRLMRQC
jgi:carboxypeptidase PM20D1